MKTAWYWHKKPDMYTNGTEIKEHRINPLNFRHLIFGKEPKTYIGEMTTSSTNGVWKTRYPYVEDQN
jgi:hypothetical protein